MKVYMKLKNRLFLLLLVGCLVFSGCAGAAEPVAAENQETPEAVTEAQEIPVMVTEAPETTEEDPDRKTISVAVFPYLPDVELFQQILTRQWEALQPDVELVYVDWDCYIDSDPEQIDVLMYDALFTSYLAENGYIQPAQEEELQQKEGVLPFALEGAYHNGELYGMPFLVCSNFLIHHTDDAELAAVQNMGELCDVLSARKQENINDGLLINYYSECPYIYLDALIDFSGSYTVYEEAPSTTELDPLAYELLCQIKQSVPVNFAVEDLGDSSRMMAFNEGRCTAYFGYSEDMSLMDDIVDEITIRSISYSEKENIQLYFADIASMGAHVTDPAQQEWCIQLMNLLGSVEFQSELCFATGDAQYLLPAQCEVYAQAQEVYPMYGQLWELVKDEKNQILRFGEDIHVYLSTAYTDLA